MLDFELGKMLIVGIVALIVIGPKELPGVLRTVGRMVARMRLAAREFQTQFMEAMREADVADVEALSRDVAKTSADLTAQIGLGASAAAGIAAMPVSVVPSPVEQHWKAPNPAPPLHAEPLPAPGAPVAAPPDAMPSLPTDTLPAPSLPDEPPVLAPAQATIISKPEVVPVEAKPVTVHRKAKPRQNKAKAHEEEADASEKSARAAPQRARQKKLSQESADG